MMKPCGMNLISSFVVSAWKSLQNMLKEGVHCQIHLNFNLVASSGWCWLVDGCCVCCI